MSVSGLTLFFEARDRDTVELVRQACEKSTRLIQEHWGLETPKDCRVYIMTSWLDFVFRSAPWRWKVLLALTLPLWAPRARQTWSLAGGWEQRYGQRRAVGVKPPRVLQLADRGIGNRFFVKEAHLGEKVQHITCHELTHAFTSHLPLPTWLKEGLAMVTVDKFVGKPTVQYRTLQVLARAPGKHSPGGRQKLRVGEEEALVELYARGYWLTRYVEETRPGLLKTLLSQRRRPDDLESGIAAAYGKSLGEFWDGIDRETVSYFQPGDEKERGQPT
jgi:hypothetical protein